MAGAAGAMAGFWSTVAGISSEYDGLASTDPGTDGTPENESDLGNHIKIKFR